MQQLKFQSRLLAVAAGIALSLPAQALDVAADAHVGTMGPGVGLALEMTRSVNLRVGLNAFDYDIDVDDEEGLEYDASLDLSNQYGIVDWYPVRRSGFHLSAGVFLNNNEISASAVVQPGDNARIGNTDALAGTRVDSAVGFKDAAGYAGIGWGNVFSGGMVSLGLDLGVVMQGSPEVDLAVTCPSSMPDCISDADVEQERRDFEDEISDFDVMPLVQFSLGVNF